MQWSENRFRMQCSAQICTVKFCLFARVIHLGRQRLPRWYPDVKAIITQECQRCRKGDKGRHGTYYHVSFYDLQAQPFTMLPNSMDSWKKNGCSGAWNYDLWLVNASKTSCISSIANLWKTGCSVEEHRKRYVTEYYGAENDTAQLSIMEDCIRDYPRAMLPFRERG